MGTDTGEKLYWAGLTVKKTAQTGFQRYLALKTPAQSRSILRKNQKKGCIFSIPT
jgi:hypothetical protein